MQRSFNEYAFMGVLHSKGARDEEQCASQCALFGVDQHPRWSSVYHYISTNLKF